MMKTNRARLNGIKMKGLICCFLVSQIVFCSVAFAIDYKSIIISQKNIPISITGYAAEYQEGNKYELAGIHHKVKYKNTGTKKIEAIQFGLVSFDVWNEYLNKTLGLSLAANDPGDSENGTWVTRTYEDYAFLTGLAYVNKIKYSDGTIWKADLNEVKSELLKIQKNFDVNELEAKPDKK